MYPQKGLRTYHCSLFVGQKDPDDGFLGGARVGSAGVGGGLQDRQGVGGRGKGLGPPSDPAASHLDLVEGWHWGWRAGEVCAVPHGLQQLLLPLLQGVQFTGVLLIGLGGQCRGQCLYSFKTTGLTAFVLSTKAKALLPLDIWREDCVLLQTCPEEPLCVLVSTLSSVLCSRSVGKNTPNNVKELRNKFLQ